MRWITLSLASAVLSTAHAQQQQRLDVPVTLGRHGDVSDCAGGEVYRLDPKGDNFLSVRSGPGGREYREIDRLVGNGQEVAICGYNGQWAAVIYLKGIGIYAANCNNRPPAPGRPYPGPCNAGWVHRNYVRVTAG